MQKFKEKERNSIVNARNDNKDEYRCVARTSLGGLIRSAPTFIQIAGRCNIFCTYMYMHTRARADMIE